MALTLPSLYQPLDHSGDTLRLFHILPGPVEADIECYLTYNNLTKLPWYVALSYE
jgi:hypothetical protein